MRQIFNSSILLFLFLCASIAQAQETLDVSDVSLGQEVDGAVALGDLYDKESISDWTIICVKTEINNDPCHMGQRLYNGDGAPVAEVSIAPFFDNPEVAAGMNIITPLETLLTMEVIVDIDQSYAKRYPFAYCSEVGCLSRLGLSIEDVDTYKAGSKGLVSIVSAKAPDQLVTLEMSLSGFTKAYDTLLAMDQ